MDPYTELIIKNDMAALLKDRTSIVIAQRLATVRNADRILVIDNWKIIEQGNNRALIEKSMLYCHLYKMQFKETRGIVVTDDNCVFKSKDKRRRRVKESAIKPQRIRS